MKEQFIKIYESYVPTVVKTYEKYLPEIKECDIFKYDAKDKRYAWFFADRIAAFDYSNINISADDCMTLADGAKGLVYAHEDAGFKITKDHNGMMEFEKGKRMHAAAARNDHFVRHQDELCYSSKEKISALYDIYEGNIKTSDIEMYAQLIEQGYAFKDNDKLICDVAVHTEKSKKLFEKINSGLIPVLAPLCKELNELVSKVVASTIPPQLKEYVRAYTVYEIGFCAASYFTEALYNKGFITALEDDDKTPVCCWID